MDFHIVHRGESVCNTQDRFPRRTTDTGLPLTKQGHIQANATAQRFARLTGKFIINCSSAKRVKETVEYISRAAGAQMVADDRLWGRELGEFAGLTRGEVIEQSEWYSEKLANPDYSLDFAYTGGETTQTFLNRVTEVWEEIWRSYTEKSVRVVIATHDDVVVILCHVILGLPFTGFPQFGCVDNGSVNRFEFAHGKASMSFFNDTSHLSWNKEYSNPW